MKVKEYGCVGFDNGGEVLLGVTWNENLNAFQIACKAGDLERSVGKFESDEDAKVFMDTLADLIGAEHIEFEV